ncbi:MAG: beta-galactosidase [Acidobacteriota bacterium]
MALILTAIPALLHAKTVVFWQPGFPTVSSEPLQRATLAQALAGMDAQFADLSALENPATLAGAELLVLPYGSAFPADAWKQIHSFLHSGGSLLVAGGQPFHVPVSAQDGKFIALAPQDTYARAVDFRHTYPVPVAAGARFAWKSGYGFPAAVVRARRYFAVEGQLNGLGYMVDREGLLVAAPVIFSGVPWGSSPGSRIVALDFDPEPGYWQSDGGLALLRQCALYASQGAIYFSVETQFAVLRPGEAPSLTIHVQSHRAPAAAPQAAEVKVVLRAGARTIDTADLPIPNLNYASLPVPFHQALAPGFYTVSAQLVGGGRLLESYENGFWVEDAEAVNAGSTLSVGGNFLARDGAPYFPVGTNYFTTEDGGWDFASPRNALVWDRDFAEMASHGVTFVRTGVWMSNAGFLEPNGGVNQRFLRNLEGFLLCAQRHHIAVNFTFFAFSPHSGPEAAASPQPTAPGNAQAPPPNPYLDPAAVQAEQAYIRSVVEPFRHVPWLTWDLINEPSFSNPHHIFRGNYPNGDPAEIAAWRKWLREKYSSDLAALAQAWRVPAETLGSFDAVPLPTPADLMAARSGNPDEVRALDYNLFAQAMFGGWVRSMVALIRSTGSRQLIDVGQDEGGVTDRLLNQFYAGDGVSFTTNHTYWQDDALLWDSVAAKRPDVPNITGETGYQPVWAPDGAWRYDEFTGLGLIERKWALGFAAGSSGALQWDWAREPDFGMKRSDGSAKVWENMMRSLGAFAAQAEPAATSLTLPQVALVLPQSLQMSVAKQEAIQAQQAAVRALYAYARGQAYAVGEYQIDLLGSPKLILLPAPLALTDRAWKAIETHVRDGAVLLVTGPFGADAHLHETGRQSAVGLPYATEPLLLREQLMRFPGGEERLTFAGDITTTASQAALPEGALWAEKPLGKGRILFAALPLELNSNLQAVGDVYRYALKIAGVAPVYSTTLADPGILIAPTQLPQATLYVLTSESNQQQVEFTDTRSGRRLTGTLGSGRAALLLVGADGKLLAAYNWSGR